MTRTHRRPPDLSALMNRLAKTPPMTTTDTPVPVDAAIGYATGMGWAVLPGCDRGRSGRRCGRRDCLTALPHPATRHAGLAATRDDLAIRRWWRRHGPAAPILSPAGHRFDVLDLPRYAGPESLRRLELMGYRLGPVARTGQGRVLIWVRTTSTTGAATDAVERRAWPYADLGLCYRSLGDYVLLPPSSGICWLEPPVPYTEPTLPHGADLLGTIAHTCRQLRDVDEQPRRTPGPEGRS